MSDRCEHHDFAASIKIARLEDSGRFMAEIRVRCGECNRPFQFLGLEPGMNTGGARVSVDGLEAHLAICPQGEVPSPMDSIMVNIGSGGRSNG